MGLISSFAEELHLGAKKALKHPELRRRVYGFTALGSAALLLFSCGVFIFHRSSGEEADPEPPEPSIFVATED